ncbi:MAG: hypothetical protein Q8P67_18315 [archaeon]|nr:hypothetical protein [archaeon]
MRSLGEAVKGLLGGLAQHEASYASLQGELVKAVAEKPSPAGDAEAVQALRLQMAGFSELHHSLEAAVRRLEADAVYRQQQQQIPAAGVEADGALVQLLSVLVDKSSSGGGGEDEREAAGLSERLQSLAETVAVLRSDGERLRTVAAASEEAATRQASESAQQLRELAAELRQEAAQRQASERKEKQAAKQLRADMAALQMDLRRKDEVIEGLQKELSQSQQVLRQHSAALGKLTKHKASTKHLLTSLSQRIANLEQQSTNSNTSSSSSSSSSSSEQQLQERVRELELALHEQAQKYALLELSMTPSVDTVDKGPPFPSSSLFQPQTEPELATSTPDHRQPYPTPSSELLSHSLSSPLSLPNLEPSPSREPKISPPPVSVILPISIIPVEPLFQPASPPSSIYSPPAPPPASPPADRSQYAEQYEILLGMGFEDSDETYEALVRAQGEISVALAEI